MDMENNEQLSAQQSLKIISEAIEQSRKDMTRSCGKTLLMWGTIICLTATVIGFLWKLTGSWYWNFMWLVMVFGGLLANRKITKSENIAGTPKMFVNDMVKNIWKAFAVTVFIAILAGPFSIFDGESQSHELPITATIIICISLAAFITGLVLKSNTIILCNCAGAYSSTSAALESNGAMEMAAVFMAGLIMMVVPALIILYRMKLAGEGAAQAKNNE